MMAKMMPVRLLVIDQDSRYGEWLKHHLGVICPDSPIGLMQLSDFNRWSEELSGRDCDVLMLAASFGSSPEDPQAQGLELLRRLRDKAHFPAVIAVAEEGNELTAVRALQLGAVDYLPKRLLTPERLKTSVKLALRMIEKRVARRIANLAPTSDAEAKALTNKPTSVDVRSSTGTRAALAARAASVAAAANVTSAADDSLIVKMPSHQDDPLHAQMAGDPSATLDSDDSSTNIKAPQEADAAATAADEVVDEADADAHPESKLPSESSAGAEASPEVSASGNATAGAEGNAAAGGSAAGGNAGAAGNADADGSAGTGRGAGTAGGAGTSGSAGARSNAAAEAAASSDGDRVDEARAQYADATLGAAEDADAKGASAEMAAGQSPASQPPPLSGPRQITGEGIPVPAARAPGGEFMPANFIPGYTIHATIGESEKAAVYVATSDARGENVALKVSKTLRDEAAGRQFLEREYTAILAIRNPAVVQIHDYGVHAGYEYLVMEYLPRGDLKSRMQLGLTEQEAVRYVGQIAAALHVVHHTGLLHRDLKPPNVMLRENDDVALIDFGLARALDGSTPSTRTGVLRGSPYYMSPEQALGEVLDARSDFYSLGVIFYEMLTGKKPYTGGSAMDVLQQHVNAAVPMLPKPLAHHEPVLLKLMAKARADRFATAEEILEALPIPADLPEADARDAVAIESSAA